MNLLSSLRSRIFLTSALLAVLSVGAAIYLVSATVTREAENALNREMAATRAIVNELRTTRAQTFTALARVIADAPFLKAAVATDDPATVQDVADDLRRQLNSDRLLVTSRSGRVLATVGFSAEAAEAVARQPAMRHASPGRETASVIAQPDGVLHLVAVPIVLGVEAPEFLGTLSVGYLFDEALATQIRDITGSEIAFAMNGQVLAATLAPALREPLGPLLGGGAGSRNVTLAGEEYVALPLPLAPDADRGSGLGPALSERSESKGPAALILRSRAEQRRLVRAIRAELSATAIVAALLAMVLSFAVARTITRPLATITGVMREVAATGDLTRKIALRGGRRWDDEDARLLAATFNTLTDSIARIQREMSQKERLSSLGRLSTVIAHEVRNPLMIIKASLHALRQPQVTAAAVREAAADIDEEVGRLNRIVNEVLDFARPIGFELAPADLNALCRESVAAASATPGVPVELDLDPTLPRIVTDAERLRLALVNLVTNARQAIDGDGSGGRPRVYLSTRANGDRISIVVADTGAGISPPDLSRVFDPYFTTKRGGTGLGLPIAKNIVEGLGGAIMVTSAPGRGTEIRIDLPAAPVALS